MARGWDQLTPEEKHRFRALGDGLRASFHNVHACYCSDDSSTFFEAFEVKKLSEAEGLLLQVILSARTRGLTV